MIKNNNTLKYEKKIKSRFFIKFAEKSQTWRG